MSGKFTLKQRWPNCFTIFEDPIVASFNTAEDLMAIPYVKSWMGVDNFKRLSINVTLTRKNLLIVESTTDGLYWPIAWISKEFAGLSEFEVPKKKDIEK